ncbi:hypothetical protein QR680_018805 [Steinernema hermaphroditum]|uniref:Chitin-binding type-2 domain-containing protein n=1 Tax=Steinernema hermaphroditum TaxID=289476 RepID=A0AA39HK06_9BILA|nr:hypothetical protein QR680_018805 [Steinernema hermaphroditum]
MRFFLVAAIGALIVLSVSLTLAVVPQNEAEGGPVNCEKDGFLPDPKSCRSFYKCENGTAFRFDCGPGTLFNPEINDCDWPSKVKCNV